LIDDRDSHLPADYRRIHPVTLTTKQMPDEARWFHPMKAEWQ
jgi:hypothetical protein